VYTLPPSHSLFTDLIDALGKVAGGLQAIARLPKAERETIHQTLDDTYRLIDTTVNMVIIRLGDILLQTSDNEFLREVVKLDNCGEWITAERQFRLCSSLRGALRETETLAGKIAGAVSTKDWDALVLQMRTILATEEELGELIGREFRQLAASARSAAQDGKRAQSVRDAVRALRESLVADRQALIKQEVLIFAIV
jgi:hypothetical protein